MPIYEYVCTECGAPVEKLQKISEAPLVDCPACGHASLKRKVSAASFRLAGGGWYETDFKSEGRRHLVSDSGDKGKSGTDSSQAEKTSNETSHKSSRSESTKKPSGESGKSDSGKAGAGAKKAKAEA